jgi:SAM-dependent methyltransferase
MNKESAFDAIAAGYDRSFSNSLVGIQQRIVTRKLLNRFLAGKGSLKILEVNCGTGEDALWLSALGHHVTATDRSEAMIREAKSKASFSPGTSLSFVACGFEELGTMLKGRKFDLIFSNFSGLNCVSPVDLATLGGQLHELLNGEGHLAVVLFGKYSLMELFYFLVKPDIRRAFRRWGRKEVQARLDEGVFQPVHYYSVSRFTRILGHFQLLKKYPVGLFIPPSYMESAMQRNKRLFRWLVRLEKMAGRLRAGGEFADHTYILLKRRN